MIFRRFSSGPCAIDLFLFFFFIFLLKTLILEKTKPYNIVGENPLYKFRLEIYIENRLRFIDYFF